MRTEIFAYVIERPGKNAICGFCVARNQVHAATRIIQKYGKPANFITNNIEDFLTECYNDDDFVELNQHEI